MPSFCVHCGAALASEGRFCGACGRQAPTASPSHPSVAPGLTTLPAPPRAPARGSRLAATAAILIGVSLLLEIVVVLLFVDAGPYLSRQEKNRITIAFSAWGLVAIPSIIVTLVWLYRTWSAVPEQHRGTSPGLAVGLLFIPFFNLYWQFRAFRGLSHSIQKAIRAVSPDYRGGAGAGVGGLFSTAICASLLPKVGPFIGAATPILFVIWLLSTNAAKNDLLARMHASADAQARTAAPFSTPAPTSTAG